MLMARKLSATRKPTTRFVLRGKQGTIRIRRTRDAIFNAKKKFGGKVYKEKVVPTKPKGLFKVVESQRLMSRKDYRTKKTKTPIHFLDRLFQQK
jgi:hypothetical protein